MSRAAGPIQHTDAGFTPRRGVTASGIRAAAAKTSIAGAVNLSIGDPHFRTPGHIADAAVAAIRGGHTHYTTTAGHADVREAVWAKIQRENHLRGVTAPSDVVLTPGSLCALYTVFSAVLKPGDRILIPDPGFANYAPQVHLAGALPVGYGCPIENGHQPLIQQIQERAPLAAAILVNTPNNPTGAVWNAATLAEIVRIAEEYNLLIVSDEAYEHIVFDGAEHTSIGSITGAENRTVTIYSMSKSWAMTGWRAGYIAGFPGVMDTIRIAAEHIFACVAEPTQYAMRAALEGPRAARDEMVAEYAEMVDLAYRTLHDLPGVSVVRPEGTFYIYPRIDLPPAHGDLSVALAREAGVQTVPGEAFGDTGRAHVRLSLAVGVEPVTEGIKRLAGWLTHLGDTK